MTSRDSFLFIVYFVGASIFVWIRMEWFFSTNSSLLFKPQNLWKYQVFIKRPFHSVKSQDFNAFWASVFLSPSIRPFRTLSISQSCPFLLRFWILGKIKTNIKKSVKFWWFLNHRFFPKALNGDHFWEKFRNFDEGKIHYHEHYRFFSAL